MKIKISLLLAWLLFPGLFLFPGETKPQGNKIHFTTRLYFSYNRAVVTLNKDNIEKSLIYPYMVLELGIRFRHNLALGVAAGYSSCFFNESIDFVNLPLSLRLEEKKLDTLVLGLRAQWDFLTMKKLCLAARGRLLYFKSSTGETAVELPIVRGSSTLKHFLYEAGVELLARYRCLTGLTIFAGPHLDMLNGELTLSERIESLAGKETMTYKQKNPFGLTGGLNVKAGNHLEFNAKLYLFSKTSLSIGIFYIF